MSRCDDRAEVIIITSSPCHSPDSDSATAMSDTRYHCHVNLIAGYLCYMISVHCFPIYSPDLALQCDPGPSTKGAPRYIAIIIVCQVS